MRSIGLVVAILAVARVAPAAVINVAAGDVAGLIAAISASNTSGEDDTITLAANSTYSLTAANNGVICKPRPNSR